MVERPLCAGADSERAGTGRQPRRRDALFLQLLDRSTAKGDNVSPKRNANNYAAALFAKTTEGKAAKFTSDHFADALDRLIAAGKIAVEPYGAASRGTSRIVRRGWSP